MQKLWKNAKTAKILLCKVAKILDERISYYLLWILTKPTQFYVHAYTYIVI